MNFIDKVRDFIQNKNVVMFLASTVFMLGILACFYGFPIPSCGLFTILMIVLLKFKLFSCRKILVFVLIFYSGFFLTFCKIKNSDDLLYKVPTEDIISGRIISIPEITSNSKMKFFFKVDEVGSEKVDAKTLVTLSEIENLKSELNIGERIKVSGRIRQPFYSTNPSQFDYSAYLRNFNIFTTTYAKANDVQILNGEQTLNWKILEGLNNTRNKILKVHSKYLKSPNLEILGGIVFGDDAVTTPDYIKSSFINSGLLHILAASGMNVAFIFSFWFVILKLLKVPYKPRVLSGMLVVILYTFMTGLGPSVLRAAMMLLFVLIGKLIDRDAYSISLLSLVAVLMLIYNPAYINDVSFQLSFLVTFGLLTTSSVIAEKLDKIPSWIKVPILVPIVAQIWVAPIQMFYFNTFSLYSVFANLATVSLLSIISFCGFVSSVFAIFPVVGNYVCGFFDFFLNYLLSLLVYISNFFSGLKYCLIQTTHPEIIQLVLYYIMILVVTLLIKYEKYKKAFISVLIISLILIFSSVQLKSNNLEIIAFDVQNADSFLIKTPQDKYFMVDTGKAPYNSGNSQAKIIMLKYLKDRGIKNLEGVIVTHFDNDHSGGVPDIISSTKTKTLYLNSNKVETQTAWKIFETAKKINQNYVIADNNTEIYSEENLSIKLYKANSNSKNSSNESSLITHLKYKDFDMLFMGDAGIEAFYKIKNYLPRNVDVLKVGHHGGPDVVDDNMMNYLGSEVSLVSTGMNSFGHPNKGTLDILRKTKILRTDYMNSIKISSDGKFYEIYSYDIHDKKYQKRDKIFAK